MTNVATTFVASTMVRENGEWRDRRLTKRYFLDKDIIKEDKPEFEKFYRFNKAYFDNLQDFKELLDILNTRQDTFITRGEPLERRKNVEIQRNKQSLIDVPQNWIPDALSFHGQKGESGVGRKQGRSFGIL